jgi:hypothetical protein
MRPGPLMKTRIVDQRGVVPLSGVVLLLVAALPLRPVDLDGDFMLPVVLLDGIDDMLDPDEPPPVPVEPGMPMPFMLPTPMLPPPMLPDCGEGEEPAGGIAPGVPDCAPLPAPIPPLACDAPIAPVAPAEPDVPAAPVAPAPPPAADCAMSTPGVRTSAAMRIDLNMLLSHFQ